MRWVIKPKRVGIVVMYALFLKQGKDELCCGYYQSYKGAERTIELFRKGVVHLAQRYRNEETLECSNE